MRVELSFEMRASNSIDINARSTNALFLFSITSENQNWPPIRSSINVLDKDLYQ